MKQFYYLKFSPHLYLKIINPPLYFFLVHFFMNTCARLMYLLRLSVLRPDSTCFVDPPTNIWSLQFNAAIKTWSMDKQRDLLGMDSSLWFSIASHQSTPLSSHHFIYEHKSRDQTKLTLSPSSFPVLDCTVCSGNRFVLGRPILRWPVDCNSGQLGQLPWSCSILFQWLH